MHPPIAPTGQNSLYMSALVSDLAREMEHVGHWCPSVRELLGACHELESRMLRSSLDARLDDWSFVRARYRGLGLSVASRLNEVASVARAYGTMDEFWADADAQSTGESPHTFWDTYEHGRRRQLERTLAGVLGAEDTLLLNTGMSAVTTAIEAAELRPGDRVLTGLQSYFETSEYLDIHMGRRAVEIIRAPIDQPDAMGVVLERTRPRLVLFETTTNSPDVTVPRGLEVWLRASPESLFVCDNSVQGALTGWFSDPKLRSVAPERLLVVESATKYLSQSVVAGLLYGKRDEVERARAFARVTGQHLQEKAFNYLREGELRHVGKRMKLHSRNTEILAEQLAQVPESPFSVRLARGPVHRHRESLDIFAEGVGGLIFLVPDGERARSRAPQALCRQTLTSWQERLRPMGWSVPVRAGFGWSETSARVYESGALNQRSAPSYLRISVGIEPEEVARQLGTALCEAVEAAS